jgi:probable phosphoglycerate mutase
MSITKIVLVRHGETQWNLAGKMQGHLDSPLTDVGLAQAEAIAGRLKSHVFSAIYSSDLSRAYQTAQRIVEENLQKQIRSDSRLRERCLGIFQGISKAELETQFSKEYRLYQARDPDYIVPNGESLRQFRERCVTCLTELVQKHSGEQILVVAHGGVLVSLFKHTVGLPLETPTCFEIVNTSLNVFAYRNECWRLETWGDLGHLEQLRALDDTT